MPFDCADWRDDPQRNDDGLGPKDVSEAMEIVVTIVIVAVCLGLMTWMASI